MSIFKLLIAAKDVPLGALVCKRSGNKWHTLRDRISVFSENGTKEIVADPGTFLLVDVNGNASAINGDLELIWLATEEQLRTLLYQPENK